jgi:succinate dehydrogenase/fumarate reductase flavoprotein subunit
VVILGTGFAGLSAAITAKMREPKSSSREKMPQKYEGANSRVSGNMWWTPTNLPEALQSMEALSKGLTDKECIQAQRSGM